MIAKAGTMLLAVLVVGTGLLVGAAQPAEAKMSDTAKVIAGFAAGFVLADVLDKDSSRQRHAPRYRDTRPHYYRPPAHVIHVRRGPVRQPVRGHRPAFRHGYRTGYRHGHTDGYRQGYGDGYGDGWRDRGRARQTGWCF